MKQTNDREITTTVLSVSPGTPPAASGLSRLDDYMRLATALGPVADGAPVCLLRLLAGAELGIGPVAALTGIHVIKGKISLGAHLIAGVIRRSGRYDFAVKRLDDVACVIEFTLEGKVLGASSFNLEDAKKAGLAGNDNWRKFPRNMLFARAISNGAKWYCPDCFGGPVYVEGELDAEVVEVTPAPVEVPETPQQSAEAAPAVRATADAGAPLPTVDELREDVARSQRTSAENRLGPVTTEQVDRIAGHVKRLGLPWEKINNRLWQKYSKWTLRELTAAQADEVETALAGRAAKPAAA